MALKAAAGDQCRKVRFPKHILDEARKREASPSLKSSGGGEARPLYPDPDDAKTRAYTKAREEVARIWAWKSAVESGKKTGEVRGQI